jgi:hypothetical protein
VVQIEPKLAFARLVGFAARAAAAARARAVRLVARVAGETCQTYALQLALAAAAMPAQLGERVLRAVLHGATVAVEAQLALAFFGGAIAQPVPAAVVRTVRASAISTIEACVADAGVGFDVATAMPAASREGALQFFLAP